MRKFVYASTVSAKENWVVADHGSLDVVIKRDRDELSSGASATRNYLTGY